MTLSVNDIVQVVKNNDLVKTQIPTSKILISVRSLISECKQFWGLESIDERESLFHSSGRAEHLYKDTDLYKAVKKYLDGYGHYKMNKKKAVGYALLDHLEFMGVTEEQSADMSPEAIRKRLFNN